MSCEQQQACMLQLLLGLLSLSTTANSLLLAIAQSIAGYVHLNAFRTLFPYLFIGLSG